MLKRLILTLSITLLASQALGADYRYNVPMPKPSPIRMAAIPHLDSARLDFAQTNPDPFKTQMVQGGQGQTIQAPAGAPVIVQAPQETLRDWLQTGLMGIIAAIFAKMGFTKPAPSPAPVPSEAPATTADLSDMVERAVLRAVQSGLPGQAIQSGLSLVPGVGPLAAQLEPMLRKIVIDQLNQKLGMNPDAPPSAAASPGASFLDLVGNIVEGRIKAALDRRPA